MKTPDAFFPEWYCDEIMPADRPTPEAWLVRLNDGASAIDKFDEHSETDPLLLADGEVVEFLSRTDYGVTTLTIDRNGGFRTAHPMPVEAEECCCLDGYQSESLGSSVAESVAEMLSGCPAEDAAGEYRMSFYTFRAHRYRYDAISHALVEVGPSGANA